jgi:ankyrin repeat protein
MARLLIDLGVNINARAFRFFTESRDEEEDDDDDGSDYEDEDRGERGEEDEDEDDSGKNNNWGDDTKTPLQIAALSGNEAMVRLLVYYDANIEANGGYNESNDKYDDTHAAAACRGQGEY